MIVSLWRAAERFPETKKLLMEIRNVGGSLAEVKRKVVQCVAGKCVPGRGGESEREGGRGTGMSDRRGI